jgi:superfamily I DNA and/or RNA helicase
VQLLTFTDSEEQEKYNNEVEVLTKKLQERETDIIELQKKVIDLYEELRRAKVSV